ncbi:uncharacterized protein L201_005504 [Kwoniella dendrophila CBS 6074]|uniref:Uncharacterized protein n=1 Tax=Kwoniella dendrophila CBS 6074 TaxID=1295534 RepID=A0AAX4K1E9_9TREE
MLFSLSAAASRSTVQSTVRSFCSTCYTLSNPPKLGESSHTRPRPIKTRGGILSSTTATKSRKVVKAERKSLDQYGDKVKTSSRRRTDDAPNFSDIIQNRSTWSTSSNVHSQRGSERPQSMRIGNHVNHDDVENAGYSRGFQDITDKDTSRDKQTGPLSLQIQNLDPSKRIEMVGFDLTTSLPTIFKTKLPVYRSSLFNFRSIPFNQLPPRKLPPFPINQIHEYKNTEFTNKGKILIHVTAITSKSQVSKLAFERNKSRRKFKSAFDAILNNQKEVEQEAILGLGIMERRALINPEQAYIASITSELFDAPIQQIQNDILEGLKYLKNSQSGRRNTSNNGILPKPRYIPRGKVEPSIKDLDAIGNQSLETIL